MQRNMKANIARMRIGNQPGHLQSTMLSEKLYMEDKVHDLSYVIDQLRSDMNRVKVDNKMIDIR